MTATIIPFPKPFRNRRWADEPRDLLDQEMRKLALIVQDSDRRSGRDTPIEVIYARCVAAEADMVEMLKVRRPLPSRSPELLQRVLSRAERVRSARRPDANGVHCLT